MTTTSIIFTSAFFLIVLLLCNGLFSSRLLRFLTKKWDNRVQRIVSVMSTSLLGWGRKIRVFILYHLFNMSKDIVVRVSEKTIIHRDTLLDRLQGNQKQLSSVRKHTSSYLKEISRRET